MVDPMRIYTPAEILELAESEPGPTFEATWISECPVCESAEGFCQEAVFATGAPVVHGDPERGPEYTWTYEPSKGEVLKNRWMVCRACGFEQAS